MRHEEPTSDKETKRLLVDLVSVSEDLESPDTVSVPQQKQQLCRVVPDMNGFWVFHKNKIDLTTMFSTPEEKLWLVVSKHWKPTSYSDVSSKNSLLRQGVKLVKNSVIKLGRVRLRVRDIDYVDEQREQNHQ